MRHALSLAALSLIWMAPAALAQPDAKPLVTGLKNPESVVTAPNGKFYASVMGERDKAGDGAIMLIDKGQAVPFCPNLDDPRGVAAFQQWLFVADNQRVLKIDAKGNATVHAPAEAFPNPPSTLNDVVVDPESGIVYVSDVGDRKGKGGAIYKIDPKSKKVTIVTNDDRWPELHTPNGLAMDGQAHLLLGDMGAETLYRINIASGKAEKIADGLGATDGIAWDYFGQLFISDVKGGRVFAIPRAGEKPVQLPYKFKTAADLCLGPGGMSILVPDMASGTINEIPTTIPGWEVDASPLPFETAIAFPKMKWAGWEPINDKGLPVPFRAIALTHSGDSSNRVFVASQHGAVYVFPNDPNAAESRLFLDIKDRVFYSDNENEQGFLGMAFHPAYKKNGEFFIFYTLKKDKTTNVISRFKVSKDDPNRADPDSEERIFQIKRPFWNHDGGTICFGPDGYLYVALGDGGAANDPFNNAQNLNTLLGDILRIDVNSKEPGKGYAIPKDNPFVGRAGTQPEIWAYGLRNVWRMSFDRKTGKLWAADVGQNLYEEINLITKGGNYGWKLRESFHPFWSTGAGVRPDLIDPIWEYHHDIGKSITGGHVYRGERFQELDGYFIYGDYVTNKIWALKYDEAKKRVIANRTIKDRNLPILSFGEDEKGEVYLLTVANTGQAVYQFVRTK